MKLTEVRTKPVVLEVIVVGVTMLEDPSYTVSVCVAVPDAALNLQDTTPFWPFRPSAAVIVIDEESSVRPAPPVAAQEPAFRPADGSMFAAVVVVVRADNLAKSRLNNI